MADPEASKYNISAYIWQTTEIYLTSMLFQWIGLNKLSRVVRKYAKIHVSYVKSISFSFSTIRGISRDGNIDNIAGLSVPVHYEPRLVFSNFDVSGCLDVTSPRGV